MCVRGGVHINCCRTDVLHISDVYAQSVPWQGSQTYVAFPIEDGASYLDYAPSSQATQPAQNRFEGVARQLSFAESFAASLNHLIPAAHERTVSPEIIDNSDASSVGMLSRTSSISCYSSIEDLSIPDLILPCDLSLTLPCHMVSDDVCPLAIFDLSRIAPVQSVTKRVLRDVYFGDSSGDEIDVDAVPENDEPRRGDRPPCIGTEEDDTTCTILSSTDDAKKDPYKTTPQFHDSNDKVNEWLHLCDLPSSKNTGSTSESGLPASNGSKSSTSSTWRLSGERLVRCDSDSAVYLEGSALRSSSQRMKKPNSFLKTLRQVSKKLRKGSRHGNDRS